MARAEDGEIHFRGEDFIDEVSVQENVKQEENAQNIEKTVQNVEENHNESTNNVQNVVEEQPKQQEIVENINTIDYSKYETMIKEMKEE